MLYYGQKLSAIGQEAMTNTMDRLRSVFVRKVRFVLTYGQILGRDFVYFAGLRAVAEHLEPRLQYSSARW